MNKYVLLIICVLGLFIGSYGQSTEKHYQRSAADSTEQLTNESLQHGQMKKLTPGAIPELIQRSIEEDNQYRGWQITSAHVNEDETVYIIEMKNGNEVEMYRFDRNGNRIDQQEDTP